MDDLKLYGKNEKQLHSLIQAPDGIRTHDPPWSSTDALTTELVVTLWWARAKCGYLTRAALESNTHISLLLTIESPVAQWLEHQY